MSNASFERRLVIALVIAAFLSAGVSLTFDLVGAEVSPETTQTHAVITHVHTVTHVIDVQVTVTYADTPFETYEVTAYTAGAESTGKDVNHPLYGVTASGEYVEEGVTVAASADIPFGTQFYVPYFDGYNGMDGIFTVEDRGGAITDGRLDVYISDLDEALRFGRRELDVLIKNEGETE